MAVNDAPCSRTDPHYTHGWVRPEDMEVPGMPEFQMCPGLPERAGREGDVQPLPVGTDEVDTQTLAMQLIDDRRALGIRRYGQPLQPSNGRDSLWDAVEESLDLYVYLVNAWRVANPGRPLPGLPTEPTVPEAM